MNRRRNLRLTGGQKVSESDIIGSFGSSAFGSEEGTKSHLHYEIQKYNSKTNKWERFNPTEGKGNKKVNVVDPQDWIGSGFFFTDFNIKPLNTEMPRDNTRIEFIKIPLIKIE